jgi:hypothetical protein
VKEQDLFTRHRSARPSRRARPRGRLAGAQSLGWGVLAEDPDREVVVGAATKPWAADVVFRACRRRSSPRSTRPAS